MKLLFDQNLSRRLVGMLDRTSGEQPRHRGRTRQGNRRRDLVTCRRARFRDRVEGLRLPPARVLHGPPPKAIWVRLGNATTIEMFDALRNSYDEILRFGEDADEALLVLP